MFGYFGKGNAGAAVAASEFQEIRRLLDGKTEKEKIEGMKKLIQSTALGGDASSLYPDVVKNIFTQDLALKKLCYYYVATYAELQPEAALLAINNFQKDLRSENPLIRGLGLRTLTSVRLPVIGQVVLVSIKKAAKDTSPFVRKVAALSLSKVHALDPDRTDEIADVLSILLGDDHCLVLGAALHAFNACTPTRYELLHSHFRKVCTFVIDFEEWAQCSALDVLTRYCRAFFKDPNGGASGARKKRSLHAGWSSSESGSGSDDDGAWASADALHADHRLLLSSAQPLFMSRNPGVVLAASALYFYCAPAHDMSHVARALCKLARTPVGSNHGSSASIAMVALSAVHLVASRFPASFLPHLSDFFLTCLEPAYLQERKLSILALLASEATAPRLLSEFTYYARSDSQSLVQLAIHALGQLASNVPTVADLCISALIQLMGSPAEPIVASAVIVIKKLLQVASVLSAKSQNQNHRAENEDNRFGAGSDFPMKEIVVHLALTFESVHSPLARASVLWVMGEYTDDAREVAPDVLRVAAKTFAAEEEVVKLQTMTLAAKLCMVNPEQTRLLCMYVLDLARYDASYHVRDRARLLRALLEGAPGVAARLLNAPKPAPDTARAAGDAEETAGMHYMLTSLSFVVHHAVSGYAPLAPFEAAPPEVDRTPAAVQTSVSAMSGDDRWEEPKKQTWSRSSRSRSWSASSGSSTGSRSRSGSYSSYSSRSRSPSPARSRSRSISEHSRSRSRSRSGSESPRARSRSASPRSQDSWGAGAKVEEEVKVSSAAPVPVTEEKKGKANLDDFMPEGESGGWLDEGGDDDDDNGDGFGGQGDVVAGEEKEDEE